MKYKRVTKENGFTLIELLVSIAIISLLASIAYAFTGNARVRAQDTKKIVEVKQVERALNMYELDNGRYPGTVGVLYEEGGAGGQNLATLFQAELVDKGYISGVINSPDSTYSYFNYGDVAIISSQTSNENLANNSCGDIIWDAEIVGNSLFLSYVQNHSPTWYSVFDYEVVNFDFSSGTWEASFSYGYNCNADGWWGPEFMCTGGLAADFLVYDPGSGICTSSYDPGVEDPIWDDKPMSYCEKRSSVFKKAYIMAQGDICLEPGSYCSCSGL